MMRAEKRVLVRAPNWIGDAVMCEPALASLRMLFPAADVTVLARPAIAELFRGHPGVDRILVYEHRGRHAGLVGKWGLANQLRRAGFTLAILFQNAFEAAWLAFLAGIPRRYGYATDGRAFLLTEAIPVPARQDIGHQVRYYYELLRPLGAADQPGAPRLFLSEEEERDAARRLAEGGIAEEIAVIGVNPGSVYGGAKRWLPDRFAETADRLVRCHEASTGKPARAVIVGGRGEEALGRAVAANMTCRPLVLSGQTTVRELMAVTKRCSLFLTNDTGPMHIAAAFEVPLVAVFGPTDWQATAPFGIGHAIVREPVECSPCLLRECPIDHRCMTRVTVDAVYEAAARSLREGREARGERQGAVSEPLASSPLPRDPLVGITVFLDRDGTLNRDTGYVKTPDELDLFPNVAAAVARLKRAGARLVVVTNQSGIARGFITADGLEAVHAALREKLAEGGASLDAIYFCPHHPEEGCICRKPQTAMVDRAAAQLGLDPSGYYLIGDQRRDMDLARRIGARSILVTTGPTSLDTLAALQSEGQPPDHVASGLADAAEWILLDVQRRWRPAPGPQLPEVFPGEASALKADR